MAYAPNLIDFGPLIDQISIFLNETNFIWKESLNYIFSLTYSSISDENITKYLGSRYLQNLSSKIEITQSVSKIFAWNFRNQFRIEFRPILWVAMFDDLAAKFWILPGKVMNLAARYRAITYREYVDIAPTGVSTQPPPEFVPPPLVKSSAWILKIQQSSWMDKCFVRLHIFVSSVHKMVNLTFA